MHSVRINYPVLNPVSQWKAYVIDEQLGLGVGRPGPLEGPLNVILTERCVPDALTEGTILIES